MMIYLFALVKLSRNSMNCADIGKDCYETEASLEDSGCALLLCANVEE